MDDWVKGSKELFDEVIDAGLCMACGACSAACPYLAVHNGKVRLLDNCTLAQGQCYQYCPRTSLDINKMTQCLFATAYAPSEIGVTREIILARATDAALRAKTQDGGAFTSLLALALEEGSVKGALVSRATDGKTPEGLIVRTKEELPSGVASKNEPGPILAVLNKLPTDSREALAVAGLPCHITAVAKMRTYPPEHRIPIENIKVVIGLFCVTGASPACKYCPDMTAEFADISVGTGRNASDGWNPVLVRTAAGQQFLSQALKKKAIETRPMPEEALAGVKQTSINKKNRAFKNIIAKTGDKKNLLYLAQLQPYVEKFLNWNTGGKNAN